MPLNIIMYNIKLSKTLKELWDFGLSLCRKKILDVKVYFISII